MEDESEEGGDDSTLSESSKVQKFAVTKPGKLIRASIAGIPIIGSSASVLIEDHLNESQKRRINLLVHRVRQIEESLSSGEEIYSEDLIEFGVRASLRAEDDFRATLIGTIITRLHENDPYEFRRKFLIDVAATLTRYELALLISLVPPNGADQSSQFRSLLVELAQHQDQMRQVREFSLQRLKTFNLLIEDGEEIALTPFAVTFLGLI